jgi:hypothetical protein
MVEVLVIKGNSRPGETLHLLSCRPYLIHLKRRDVVEKIVGFHRIGTLLLLNSVQLKILWLVNCGGASASQLENFKIERFRL